MRCSWESNFHGGRRLRDEIRNHLQASRGIGFQPMVAVRRDIDPYSDRISTSEAIFCFNT
jgi:hypothetical protein